MQIVESSVFGVRVVLTVLRRQETPLRFRLFPMIHVGSPEYYREVRARVERCDLAVVEGTPGGKALTRSYRMVPNSRNGLVVQDLWPRSFTIPVINPDLNGAEFDAGWRRVPLWQRAMIRAAGPVVGITGALGGRDWVARRVALDDELTWEQQQAWERAEALEDLIMDSRDERLVKALFDIHDRRAGEDIEVAVVYGAAHIPAVVHALLRFHRYVPGDAEYLTVFDL